MCRCAEDIDVVAIDVYIVYPRRLCRVDENSSAYEAIEDALPAINRCGAPKAVIRWANIDSVETARHFGIGADRSVNYHADAQGTAVVFESVAETVCSVRERRPLAPNWSAKINRDYNSRKKNR